MFDNALYSGDVLFCNFKLISTGSIEQILKALYVESSTDILTSGEMIKHGIKHLEMITNKINAED
jgi:precorrin isomerase